MFTVAFLGAGALAAQVPTASFVVERSIAYHDPLGHWDRARFRLNLRETRPDGTERQTRLVFHKPLDSFEIQTDRDEARIEGLMAAGECVLTLNGSIEFSEAEREKFRLTCERIGWLRDYYTYLWGLPMKLHDPGTLIDPEVTDAWYQERPVWSVRATYDESVGSDTWYFYFDQLTYALVGYRFYHDEAKRDGEYIVLEGETEASGLKIPTKRAWYVNADGRHLGDDILVDLEVQP
jgi:hypothetical protein